MSFTHFTKQPIIDILISPESWYSDRKRITRIHIMFVFKIDNMPFTVPHCTLESNPGFMLEFQYKKKKKKNFNTKKSLRDKKIFTQAQEKETSF